MKKAVSKPGSMERWLRYGQAEVVAMGRDWRANILDAGSFELQA